MQQDRTGEGSCCSVPSAPTTIQLALRGVEGRMGVGVDVRVVGVFVWPVLLRRRKIDDDRGSRSSSSGCLLFAAALAACRVYNAYCPEHGHAAGWDKLNAPPWWLPPWEGVLWGGWDRMWGQRESAPLL